MKPPLAVLFLLGVAKGGADPLLPSLYEYYTAGGIYKGLDASGNFFTLNGRNISIYGGTIHYFRVPREYWRDRLRKLRAAGLNAVETYVPWNLHEPYNGTYDFGAGGTEMEDFLNVTEFLKIAQEEDLFAILRPGPYICAEFEFGGFPSWLLRENGIKFRTSEESYMKYVTRYFNVLLQVLKPLQFTNGGPIIMFQVENEYGSTEDPPNFLPDKRYLWMLRQLLLNNGIVELLFTSDSAYMHGTKGTLPGVLFQTVNFGGDPEKEFETLEKLQPGRPIMAMEFWTGWFDHWTEIHHTRSNEDFYNVYEKILQYPASVNMYMFHGGTNFGFLNGANFANSETDNSGYQPDTTSYDYDAPLTETGDYTIKYVMVKELLRRYNPIKTRLPRTPAITYKTTYASIEVESQLLLDEILNNVEFRLFTPNVLSMEMLPINNNSGQSYGYIVYRKRFIDIPANSILTIKGRVCDSVVVLVDGILMSNPLDHSDDLNSFGFWRVKDAGLVLGPQDINGATLDLVVENWGRGNFGLLDQFNQFKGLWQGDVLLNGNKIMDWEVAPLEFKRAWIDNLKGWHRPRGRRLSGPSLYRARLVVDAAADTFVDMRRWRRGAVAVNGRVVGRYARVGPQQALYVPASLLRRGANDVVVFEQYAAARRVSFADRPVYRTRK